MRITIETWGGFKIIIGNVGLGWRRGGVRAFGPAPLWRTWWELRLVLIYIGRDRVIPIPKHQRPARGRRNWGPHHDTSTPNENPHRRRSDGRRRRHGSGYVGVELH